ncbi:MAG: sigma-54-dependent Fis family transcriptional regulator [Leptospiraceae bacterium]|nr:MAG: sigma-54-dependent Fis family transcriptional regulator [Leptospiraceae bacterium]
MAKLKHQSKIYENILEVVTNLTSLMNQSQNAQYLLEKFLDECIKITEADSGSIMLLDENKEYLNAIVAIGLNKESSGMKLKIGEGITGWVAKHKKPRIIDDAYNEKDYIRVRDDLISEIAVPMIYNDDIIGVLSLDSKKPSAFTEEDAILLQIVANLSVAIFVKIQDNELLKIREKFHKILLEISSVITKSTNLQEVFEEIMTITQKVIRIHRSTLFLYDKKDKLLKVHATYGFHNEESKSVVYEPGEGITGNVFLNKKPVFIPSAKNEPGFLNRMKIVTEDLDLGYYCCPILSGVDVVGVFSIFTHIYEENNSKEILEFLQILSTFISQAITIQKLIEEETQPFIAENIRLRLELSKKYRFGNLIGKSPKMIHLFEQIQLIADSKSSVLLIGESGTGKELIASAIHYNSSRKEMPFIKINCAAIPETLLESELFGYKKGAFTGATSDKKGKFEIADGGTIFLDEIGEMDLSLQAKLLRVLQEKEIEPIGGKTKKVDIRIIAATNANLEELIQQKRFRPDLYYRLNVIRLEIPPLRERKEDILLLTKYFIEKYAKENEKEIHSITPEAIKLLESYDWPGNVRELENLIERAVVLNQSGILDVKDFKEILNKIQTDNNIPTMSDGFIAPAFSYEGSEFNELNTHSLELYEGRVYQTVISEIEKKLILYALKRSKYIKTKAAKFLGINRNTLDKRIKELNIEY